jgi:hypothetical protein
MVIIRCFEIAALPSVSSNPKHTPIYGLMCSGAMYGDGWFFLCVAWSIMGSNVIQYYIIWCPFIDYIIKVLERINRLLSLIRHGPHWKWRVQQFFYCCVCIRYRGNVSTEPLPSNGKGGFLPTRCLATIGGNTQTHTQTATWSHKPTLGNDRRNFSEPLPSNHK